MHLVLPILQDLLVGLHVLLHCLAHLDAVDLDAVQLQVRAQLSNYVESSSTTWHSTCRQVCRGWSTKCSCHIAKAAI